MKKILNEHPTHNPSPSSALHCNTEDKITQTCSTLLPKNRLCLFLELQEKTPSTGKEKQIKANIPLQEKKEKTINAYLTRVLKHLSESLFIHHINTRITNYQKINKGKDIK